MHINEPTGTPQSSTATSGLQRRHLIPMQIGNALVYVEELETDASVQDSGDIHPVGPPSPKEAFERAGAALHECVRILGERVDALSEHTRPATISIEFALTFEAKGRANAWVLLPVFVTTEAKTGVGLKVTCTWGKGERAHANNEGEQDTTELPTDDAADDQPDGD